ncbi:hypothetical protein EV363DRAFT_364063 [Boletus edulis]|nr:hypothetical protein EV363DRAFT_364063 [Boletus edulis]
MSLYTPVFPSLHEPSTSRKGPNENTMAASSGKQQNYIEFLRDVHLFLSTQSDVLSPPSRPSSPLFDHRVREVRDKVQEVVNATEGKTSGGKWTRVSQTLKLGCVRGRHWSVSGDAPCALEQDTIWILPEEESEWIEWEKKREENRRLKANTIASRRTGTAASVALDSQETNHASVAESSQLLKVTRERPPPGVSPTILRAAKEKVTKWQASVAPETWHSTTSSSSSTRAVAIGSVGKSKSDGPQRSRTLDFAVVKPTAKLIIGKKEIGSLSRPGVRGGSAPVPLQKFKSSTPSKAVSVPEVEALVGVDKAGSKEPPKVSPVKDDIPKIADVPETPYLPPSFPAHLETSTPLPDSVQIVRAKPSPILPLLASSSTPLPSPSANPLDERQSVIADPHAANASSCLPPRSPQIDTVQAGKRSRALSPLLGGVLDDPCVTPPAKRLRSEFQNRTTPSNHSRPVSPTVGLDKVLGARDEAGNPNLGSGPSQRDSMPPAGTEDALGFPEKLPSPTKSVKSYFSAVDSDHSDSPMKANLLLESPVSPMLSYAQNASGFLPQVTSTQAGRGSPSAGRTNHGMFNGMGYSSQFDVERHVDRVSELLEKDVDFDGWLRDVRTVEMSQD